MPSLGMRKIEGEAKGFERTLIALDRSLAAPFEIALDGAPCRIEQIYRLLPGKRLAARGRFQGREVLVKLFVGRGARRRCRRERRGLALLRTSGVRAPQLLKEAPIAHPGLSLLPQPSSGAPESLRKAPVARPKGWALLFEFLPEARPIALEPPAQAEAEAAWAAQVLARLHERGAVHRDPHRGNFLISGGQLHLVDGDSLRKGGPPLGERRSLRALADFLAQYPPAADVRLAALLERYARERGWSPDAARRSRLENLLRLARRRRLRRHLGKTQRDCTEFHCQQSWRRACLAKRDCWNGALQAFAADPETGLAGAKVVQQGSGLGLFRLAIGGQQALVKRYGAAGRWTGWRLHSPARAAWRDGHRLNFLEPEIPPPIALIEQRWGPLHGASYLVMGMAFCRQGCDNAANASMRAGLGHAGGHN